MVDSGEPLGGRTTIPQGYGIDHEGLVLGCIPLYTTTPRIGQHGGGACREGGVLHKTPPHQGIQYQYWWTQDPSEVLDKTPEEEDIAAAVQRLQKGKAGAALEEVAEGGQCGGGEEQDTITRSGKTHPDHLPH